MKGLQEATDNGTIFLVVKHGSICQESKKPIEGYETVVTSNPRVIDPVTKEPKKVTKYIKRYKAVEALISKVEWYDKEHEGTRFFGWKIYLDADGVPAILDLPFDSRAANRFMKTAENIDFSQPVELRAWHDNKTDATAFYIGQNGKSVPQRYTMDNPGNCPPPVQNPVTKKWNFDSQKEFLHEQMMNVVLPAVEAVGNEMPILERAVAATAGQTTAPDLEDEDIPF